MTIFLESFWVELPFIFLRICIFIGNIKWNNCLILRLGYQIFRTSTSLNFTIKNNKKCENDLTLHRRNYWKISFQTLHYFFFFFNSFLYSYFYIIFLEFKIKKKLNILYVTFVNNWAFLFKDIFWFWYIFLKKYFSLLMKNLWLFL